MPNPRPQKINNKVLLDKKKQKFVEEYIDTWNATKAVKNTYWITNDNVAAVKWSRMIRSDKIKAYLDGFGKEAGSKIIEIMRKKNAKDNITLDAAKYVYDHVHWKAIQKQEISWKDWGIIQIEDLNKISTEQLLLLIKQQK